MASEIRHGRADRPYVVSIVVAHAGSRVRTCRARSTNNCTRGASSVSVGNGPRGITCSPATANACRSGPPRCAAAGSRPATSQRGSQLRQHVLAVVETIRAALPTAAPRRNPHRPTRLFGGADGARHCARGRHRRADPGPDHRTRRRVKIVADPVGDLDGEASPCRRPPKADHCYHPRRGEVAGEPIHLVVPPKSVVIGRGRLTAGGPAKAQKSRRAARSNQLVEPLRSLQPFNATHDRTSENSGQCIGGPVLSYSGEEENLARVVPVAITRAARSRRRRSSRQRVRTLPLVWSSHADAEPSGSGHGSITKALLRATAASRRPAAVDMPPRTSLRRSRNHPALLLDGVRTISSWALNALASAAGGDPRGGRDVDHVGEHK